MRSPIGVLLLFDFCLQSVLRAVPLLDRFANNGGTGDHYRPMSRYVGILYDGVDNFSYASWAAQADRGVLFMSNLYTTEPQSAVFFNPYFLAAGWMAHIAQVYPLAIINALGLLACPLLGWLVHLICGEFGLGAKVGFLAALLALFATGPSILLQPLSMLLDAFGLNGVTANGVDAFYFDLFPATAISALPYHASCTALTAAALLLVVKTFRRPTTASRFGWVMLCAAAVSVLILARPYQVAIMGILYPVCLAADGALSRRKPRQVLAETILAAAIIAPAALYVVWVSRLPMWREISQGYLLAPVSRWQIAFGFSLFWLGSASGLYRALRERRRDMLVLGVWFVATVCATLVFGKAMIKSADAAVIPYAILSAYGAKRALFGNTNAAQHGPRPRTIGATMAMFGIALAIGTAAADTAFIVRSATPRVDADVMAISSWLRQKQGTPPPLVLAACPAAVALPAFAGSRVYAGHWSLSPDNAAKCLRLERAGFDIDRQAGSSPQEFQSVLAETRPQYLMLQIGSPADRFADRLENTRPAWSGKRWRLVGIAR